MSKKRPQRFNTHYLSGSGVMMVLAEDFVVLIRLSDGLTKRFTYGDLGFPD